MQSTIGYVKGSEKSLPELYALWDKLRDVPTVENDDFEQCLDGAFLHFSIGTPVEDVWRWFEAQNANFIVGDVMQGIRKDDSPE